MSSKVGVPTAEHDTNYFSVSGSGRNLTLGGDPPSDNYGIVDTVTLVGGGNFAIPAEAVVKGIEVEYAGSGREMPEDIILNGLLQLVIDGATVGGYKGTDCAKSPAWNGDTVGSPTDDWDYVDGEGKSLWTPDNVSDEHFGIKATCPGAEPLPSLDTFLVWGIQFIVYYSKLKITKPVSGESLAAGETLTIEWIDAEPTGEDITLEIYDDEGLVEEIVTGVPASDEEYNYTVPGDTIPAEDYYIVITGETSADTDSSDEFIILAPRTVSRRDLLVVDVERTLEVL